MSEELFAAEAEATDATTVESLEPDHPHEEPQVEQEPATAITTVIESTELASGNWYSNESQFVMLQRAAKMLAASNLVPKQFQGDVANCAIGLNLASRLGMEPFLVLQNVHVINGRPSFSAAFLIAAFNACGRYEAMDFIFSGEPDSDHYGCHIESVDKRTGKKITGPKVSIGMAKAEGWYSKNGSKWQTMPDLMLRYRAAAFLIRTVCPEIALGLYTSEEIRDID